MGWEVRGSTIASHQIVCSSWAIRLVSASLLRSWCPVPTMVRIMWLSCSWGWGFSSRIRVGLVVSHPVRIDPDTHPKRKEKKKSNYPRATFRKITSSINILKSYWSTAQIHQVHRSQTKTTCSISLLSESIDHRSNPPTNFNMRDFVSQKPP